MDEGFWSCLFSNSYSPFIADIATLFGVALTVCIFFGIKKITRFFLLRARIPDLLEKIQEHASKISSNKRDYPETEDEIDEILSIAEVNIDDLRRKSSNPLKKRSKLLLKAIQKFRKSASPPKSELNDIYQNMNMTIQQIENFIEDEKWRK